MIKIDNLTKHYHAAQGKVEAINGLNLEVADGEIFGMIGPSGAGKSTLIRMLNLLEKPTAGTININGTDLTELSSQNLRAARQKIGMIFQHFNLLSSRTVLGNVAFPLEIAGVGKKKRQEKAKELIELVGLSDRTDHYPAQLSGGQKQRVGIARALANNPDLLLSDEATSSLDPESTKAVLELLAKIRDEMNLTIILITHEMGVIKDICDRVAVLEAGKIIEEGKIIDIFSSPQQPLTKKFISSVIDFDLPERIIKHIKKKRPGELVRISFVGETTHDPHISDLVKHYSVDANILYGNIDEIQGVPFGTLVLDLEGQLTNVEESIAYLRSKDLRVEVLEDV
ncbi:Methionine ABC transporter ATP-binding protein [Halanaerobium saccharolyticum subsp. saccharolyticum DSM 6643]|uniref:Methionine ABC transporter ATP-binding protein n=1 Tax=Halanaerobium saccharolyticum subsp. saccharolyticum DSM 6643 TaxID=1293054 RepID=M5E3B5_9FIRM|nr:methionine ABC transporter ATP-binding protein [Halanaerobium saccharolyticum]CCU80172.1 Methionine ABC transporter ATP-binding protein [Halanaerobium saccharolyticum subsp. saccharolyticum DSM 6643]